MKMPLDGVRVVDLSAVWAGPLGTRLLADYGAEVIKVESPRMWDQLRGLGGIPRTEAGWYNRSAYFNHNNRNKYGFALDLASDLGRETLLKLVEKSDVIVENFRADVMDKLRLGYEEVKARNPRIIYVSMPGHGKTGPEKDFSAYGTNVEQLSGLVSLTGYEGGEPMKTGISYGDPMSGTALVAAVALALRQVRRTGRGEWVEIAQRESLMSFVGEYVLDYSLNGKRHEPAGNRHPVHAPHNRYRSAGNDAWIAIACENDEQFSALCAVMEQPDLAADPRFATAAARKANERELDPVIEEWTASRGHYEAMYILQRAGVPAGAVLTIPELMADPHLRARDTWVPQTHAEAGTWEMEGLPWKLSRTPGALRIHAPCFAEHNDYVFRDLLELDEAEIEKLYDRGVTAREPSAEAHL